MAENPLIKLARLVGGAAILPGPLGHQVLGQLLISGSTSVEVAGANIALAAASGQTNAATQVAVRSMVPAAVVQALSKKKERRLGRLTEEMARQRRGLEAATEGVGWECERIMQVYRELENRQPPYAAPAMEALVLRCENELLEQEVQTLRRRLAEKATAQAASESMGRSAKSTDATPETKPSAARKASSPRSKPKVGGRKKPATANKGRKSS